MPVFLSIPPHSWTFRHIQQIAESRQTERRRLPLHIGISAPSADLDNLLRISFVDEDCEKLRSIDLSPLSASGNDAWRMALYTRVLSVISNGISIGVKHLEFLAFSSSQLRDNSAWIFGSRTGFTASDIRKSMGDFRNIRNVANRYKLMSCVYDLQLLCAIVSLQELCCL